MTHTKRIGALLLLAGCSSQGLLGETGLGSDPGPDDSAGLPEGERVATSAVSAGSTLTISMRLWGASTCDINGDGYDDAFLDGYDDEVDMIAYGSASGLRTPSTVSTEASSTRPSSRAACVGDVNADGYDDVYATDYDVTRGSFVSGTTGYEGFVALYYGGSSGLQTTAGSVSWGSGRSYNLGSWPKRFGDLDGDGESEWGYGILGYDNGETDEGAVIVEYSRLAFDTTIQGNVASAGIGYCTGGVGDVNGDGYGDLMVCTANAYTDSVGTGNMRLYYGTSSGVDTTPSWVASIGIYVTAGTSLYNDVIAGGDLDGDGYSDAVIAAYYSGEVEIFYGSASGIDASPNATIAVSDTYGMPHVEVDDLDADGYADLVIAQGYTSSCDTTGAFAVYRGTASGLDTTADYSVTGTSYGAYEVTTGDFDADGAGDVVLPVMRTSGSCYNTLNAKVFYGEGLDSDADGSFDAYDCDNGDASVYPGATESCDTIDSDCDGDFVDGASDLDGDGTPDCVDDDVDGDGDLGATDCDDSDDTIAHGAAEVVADGIDQDCDGGDTCRSDADVDGYAATSATVPSTDLDCVDIGEADTSMSATDCNDGDPGINPGIPEVVDDGVDSDCNGGETCYADADNDGHRATSGTVASSDLDCADPREGATTDPADDCNDTSATVYPGATELVGDEIDSDCDGGETCYDDSDGDGYLTTSAATRASADSDCDDANEGAATDATTDCDDASATIHPDATETAGDEIDQDCDGAERCYVDADADGYGSSATAISSDTDCRDANEARTSGDCAASDSTISPGATEICDTTDTDEDCDGLSDDDDGSLDTRTASTWYRDVDGDGYGDATTATAACDAPRFYVASGTDCDDGDSAISPGATEVPANGADTNCDGMETCYADADGDSQRDASGTLITSANLACDGVGEATAAAALDCNDADASVYDGAPEVVADGVDQDCDDGDTCAVDNDADGYGGADIVTSRDLDCADRGEADETTDCDDTSATVYPGAEELLADGIDGDCDGTERCYADGDADGFRTGIETASDDADCADDGEALAATPAGDCDDRDATAFPDAVEVVGDGIDEDCDGGELCWMDADGDGIGAPESVASDDLGCTSAGESATGDDCDDGDPAAYPGAEETPADGVDADCDGGDLCWADADHDGFGAADGTTVASDDVACDAPGEYGETPTDCDDLAESAHPGATEVEGNDVDEDCDGEAVGAPKDGSTGCGCASEPGAAGAALGLVGALAALTRRRRSAPREKASVG